MPTDVTPAPDPFEAILPGPKQTPPPKAGPAPVTPPLPVPPPIVPGPTDIDGDLLPDGPGTDSVDQALKARAAAYDDAAILDQLMQEQQAASPTGQVAQPMTPDQMPKGTMKGPQQTTQGGVASAASQVTDVAYQGLVGGPRDAIQGFTESVDWLERSMNLPGIEFTNEDGHYLPTPKFLSGEELTKRKDAGKISYGVPEVRDPKNQVSALTRGITSFVMPFGLAAKGLGGIRAAATFGERVIKGATAGGIADLLTSGVADENLANLLQEFPVLQNPVLEFLSVDKDDGFAEKRLKTTLIGLGLGPATDIGGQALVKSFTLALRAYRNGKQYLFSGDDPAKAAMDMSRFSAETLAEKQASGLGLIGNESIEEPVVFKMRDEKVGQAINIAGLEGINRDDMAKALTPKGLRPLEGNNEVYVNFLRIQTPEDIWRVINDTTAAFKDNITAATRGVRTNKQTKLAADDIEAWDLLMQRKKGGLLNAEQTVAARQLHATSAHALFDIARVAHEAPTEANLYQLRRMLAVHAAIEAEMIGVRTETARALQSWSVPVSNSKMRLGEIQEMLAYGGGMNASKEIARRIVTLQGVPGGAAALSKFAQKTWAAKTVGVVQEYWINALLSGPKTHIVNMMSNSSVAGISILERAIAARYGRLFQESGVEIGEAVAMAQGLRGSIIDGFRNARVSFKNTGMKAGTGQQPDFIGVAGLRLDVGRERYISSGTWNLRSDSWAGRAVDATGALINIPGRALMAEDAFFKTIGYRMELWAQAQRTVAQELKSGALKVEDSGKRFAEILDNPPEAIRMEAAANAAYQTFTSPPGRISRAVITAAANFPSVKWLLPFINTPGNILNYAFVEHSPLAMMSRKYKDAIRRGGPDADLARTKLALGTTAMMLAVDMAMNGHITGAGPANISERQRWERLGNKPMSIRIGDKSLSFNRMDPMGATFGYGAQLAEFLMNMEANEVSLKQFEELMAASVFSIAETVTNKSYMQGMANFVNAVEDPERYGPMFIEKFAASFVPTGVAEAARVIDPVRRQTDSTAERVLSRLPWGGAGLPAARDFWGREISYQSGFGRLYDAVSPIYGHTAKPEAADKAFLEDRYAPGMGGQSVTWEGITIPLSNRSDIKARYYELRGATKASQLSDGLEAMFGDRTLLEALNDMVTGKGDFAEEWKALDGDLEGRHKLYDKVIDAYARAARTLVREEYGNWFKQMADQQRAAKGFLPRPPQTEE